MSDKQFSFVTIAASIHPPSCFFLFLFFFSKLFHHFHATCVASSPPPHFRSHRTTQIKIITQTATILFFFCFVSITGTLSRVYDVLSTYIKFYLALPLCNKLCTAVPPPHTRLPFLLYN